MAVGRPGLVGPAGIDNSLELALELDAAVQQVGQAGLQRLRELRQVSVRVGAGREHRLVLLGHGLHQAGVAVEAGDDPPSKQRTPLLSSVRGRKVSDDEDATDRGFGLGRQHHADQAV